MQPSSEAPRPSAVRRAPRRGRQSLRTAPPGALGEDILLARHGDRIDHFRQESGGQRTVAVLRDGGTDTAPNDLGGAAAHLSPADRAQRHLAVLSSEQHAETRRELRFLARLSVAWFVVSIVVLGVMMWGATTFLEPGDLQALLSGPFGGLPAEIAEGAAQGPNGGNQVSASR